MDFRMELRSAINRCSKENGSNTPDYILANYLLNCLNAFDSAVNERDTCSKVIATTSDKVCLEKD